MADFKVFWGPCPGEEETTRVREVYVSDEGGCFILFLTLS